MKGDPCQQAPEVASGGGEDGVAGVALRMGEEVAAHSVLGLQMADDRTRGAAPCPCRCIRARAHAANRASCPRCLWRCSSTRSAR